MSYTATKDKRSQTSHERNYLINVHFSDYSRRECHVTRTEVVTTLAHPGVDTNGSVKWLEANLNAHSSRIVANAHSNWFKCEKALMVGPTLLH